MPPDCRLNEVEGAEEMSKIYDHYRSESADHQVGHMSSDGVVYNHWYKESITYAVGHVRNGVVYNDRQSESITYAVGHVGSDGVIYNDRESESSRYAIGHVDRNGVVYNDPTSESYSYAIGHVTGSIYAAGAAFLLLNASFQGPVADDRPPIKDDDEEELRRKEELKHIAALNRLRQEKMKQYMANPRIVAAAKEYAQQRAKTATIVTPLFFLFLCSPGFKDKRPFAKQYTKQNPGRLLSTGGTGAEPLSRSSGRRVEPPSGHLRSSARQGRSQVKATARECTTVLDRAGVRRLDQRLPAMRSKLAA